MVINGTFSDWVAVSSGITLLFLIYVNDLGSVINHSTIKLFADDVLLYTPANTLKDYSSLQDDLNSIFSWLISGS